MAEIDYSIKDIETLIKFDGMVKNVKVSRLTAPGENFLSLVLKIDFEVEKNGKSETISTVAKRVPLGERKTIGFNAHVMKNEIQWYTDIVPIIKKFAKEQKIEGLDFIPEYFGSRYSLDPLKIEADKDSFLLLENLILKGFKNEDRYNGFDLITTKAILKRLALFHSVTLVIKFKNPELFKVLKEYVDHTVPKFSGPADGGADKNGNEEHNPPLERKFPENILLDTMIKMPECEPYFEKLKFLVNKPKGPVTWHKVGEEPWNTIVHTDFWVNNVMVNPKAGQEPLIKFLDFQMCTYGSYAKDLIFFLLSSVNNDVTRTYLDDLLRYYYEEFTSVLIQAKIDLELTYTAYLKEVRRIALESEFNHVLFFTTIIFGEKNATLDPAIEEFNPMEHMIDMIQKMSQKQKDKLILIVSEAAERNWI